MVLEETMITPEIIEELKVHSDRTEGVGLFEDCSNSVIRFCKHMLGLEMYAWQKIIALDMMEAILNEELPREFVVLTSRQIGKTTFAAIFALWISVFNKLESSEEANSTCGIISASDIQAKLVLREVKKYMQIGNAYCRNHYSREKDDLMDKGIFDALINPDDDNNKQTLSFKPQVFVKDNDGAEVPKYGDFLLTGSKVGTRLNSYPPTASVLGQTFAYLHEDEAGRTDRFTDEAHSEFLYPTGDARNAVRLYTSTPWVTSGFFYELADPDDVKDHHNYKRYLFTIEAIKYENPKQYKNVTTQIEDEKLDGKMDAVNRKYYCKFVKGEASYFNPDDVDTLFDRDLPTFTSYDGQCDIGVDFGGKTTSKTVITISTLTESKDIIRLYHKYYEVGKDENLMRDLEELMKVFPKWVELYLMNVHREITLYKI